MDKQNTKPLNQVLLVDWNFGSSCINRASIIDCRYVTLSLVLNIPSHDTSVGTLDTAIILVTSITTVYKNDDISIHDFQVEDNNILIS